MAGDFGTNNWTNESLTLDLTSGGIDINQSTIQHIHPVWYVGIKLTADLKLTITYTTKGQGHFGYSVGLSVNGSVIIDKKWEFSETVTTFNLCTNEDLSGYSFPLKIALLCRGCDHSGGNSSLVQYENGGSLITINDKRHTHNNTEPTCEIDSTSGTTITVKTTGGGNTATKQVREDNGVWQNTPYRFTGYSKGSTHRYTAKTLCDTSGCDSDKHPLFSNTISARTWNITCNSGVSGFKTVTFTGKQTAGTGGSNSRSINYWIYKKDNTLVNSGTISAPTNIDTNGNYIINVTGLDPGTAYLCKVATVGIVDQNGKQDNTSTSDVKTMDPFEIPIECSNGAVSATTMRSYISFGASDGSTISCIATCNGTSVTKSSSGYFVFTGLTPGEPYSISYVVTVTATDTWTDKNGTVHSQTYTFTKNGTAYTDITCKAEFVTVNTTSKIIEFSSKCNKFGDIMRQRLSNDEWYDVVQDTLYRHNNQIHDSNYIIYAEIKGCFAFASDGSRTNINDSTISRTVRTLLLSISGSILEEHQHSIITTWQSAVDHINRNLDALDNTLFYFSSMKTEARKVYPYQRNDIVLGINGNTTGDYQLDKKIYSNNLTWYYCEYIITAEICDGFNRVSATVIAHTTFPHTWIFDGGKWHKAIPHIYTKDTDGVDRFVPAPGFIYDGVQWREPNGE